MWYFPTEGGAKSVTDIGMGGQNPYISTNSQYYNYSFCPRGGQIPLPTSMRGPWPDFPPWIRHWLCGCQKLYYGIDFFTLHNPVIQSMKSSALPSCLLRIGSGSQPLASS